MRSGFWMQLAPALIVTRREVRDHFRDWRILFPILALTLFFPGLMNFTASQALAFVHRYGATLVGERLIPFLLMIVGFFPISVSLVIALESFVGEKERHSIEPLLISPLTDWQLYLGKLLAAIIPPLLASYLGIIVYLAGMYLTERWWPSPGFLLQIVLLTTVQALVMVSGAVVVSSQTTSVRAANLLASFIIIPMALLVQGESIVMFWGRYDGLWWIILAQALIAGLLVRTGVAHFNREELLGRELDTLNLKWGWRTFWGAFRNGAQSLGSWYRLGVIPALRSMGLPLILVGACSAAAVWLGGRYASIYVLPPGIFNLDELSLAAFERLDGLQFFSAAGIGSVWFHNLRALMLAGILGIFSFGVLAVLVVMLPLAMVGYFMMTLAQAGLPPLVFLSAFILPHGILEVPAIILGGAAILRLGATLAVPAQGQTIGEAWLHALADLAKVMVGVVMPMLLGAAILEVALTPRLAVLILGG